MALLISLADYKANYSPNGSADTSEDAKLTDRITAMSAAILAHIRWPIDDNGVRDHTQTTYTTIYSGEWDARYNVGPGRASWLIPPAVPLVSVTSLHSSTDGEFGATDLHASGEYRIEAANDPRAVRIRMLPSYSWVDGSEVKLVCVAGYTTVPDDLESAAGMLVAWSLDQDRRRGIQTRTTDGRPSETYRPEEWPPDILAMLERHLAPWVL